jgi:hypothetical protein
MLPFAILITVQVKLLWQGALSTTSLLNHVCAR